MCLYIHHISAAQILPDVILGRSTVSGTQNKSGQQLVEGHQVNAMMCRVMMVRFMFVQGRMEAVGQLTANAVAFLSYPWVAPVAPEKAHGDEGR